MQVNTIGLPTVIFATSVYWSAGLKPTIEAFGTYLLIFMLMLMVRIPDQYTTAIALLVILRTFSGDV